MAERRSVKIGARTIGENEPTFVIAEGACNHLCRMDLATRMVDEAAAAGADAIKFQTYKAETLVRSSATAFWGDEKVSQLDYYRRLDRFGRDEYQELFRRAKEKGIIGFSTPFDLENATMLHEIGMPLFKIASCDNLDKRFLRHVAEFGKPIILSIGGSTPEEADLGIRTILETGNNQLVVLSCLLAYPTKNEDANLRRIIAVRERYPDLVIGLSDHTQPDEHMVIDAVAVALGARVIEKHFTLDRSMTGSGHFFAMAPTDLAKMVRNIRLAETVMGKADLGVHPSEEAARYNARRALVANVPIPAGTRITSEMIGVKRPADGLPPSEIDRVIGRTAKSDIGADENIRLEMLA